MPAAGHRAERRAFLILLAVGTLLALAGLPGTGYTPATPLARAALFTLLAGAGFLMTRSTGLTIRPRPGRAGAAIAASLAASAATAVWILLLERAHGDAAPAAGVTPWLRLGVLTSLSFTEEMVWRLGAVTAILWTCMRLTGTRNSWITCAAIALAQTANLTAHGWAPHDAATVAHDALRFIFPGLVWGLLYARHGLIAAQLGHTGCHAMMAPFVVAFSSTPA